MPWSGTTGFTEDDLDDLARRFAGPGSGAPNCIVAANFAIGAVLMMRFAELAAPWFDGRRDHRAPPRREARRPVGHRPAHGRADGGGPRRRPGRATFPPDRTVTSVVDGRPRRGRARPACASTRCGCPAWWPTRR